MRLSFCSGMPLVPHRCNGCHNPETWDFSGGIEIDINELIQKIAKALTANGVQRNFSILGGEPLCEENIDNVAHIVFTIKQQFPNIKIFLWTGYRVEEIPSSAAWDLIKNNIDYLIDGPYIKEQRDITLKWRGSRNQRILTTKGINDII